MTPPLLAVIGVLFLGIGGFSFVLAQKRMRYARAQGQTSVWYKNLTLMTSIEYILLSIIIFLNLSSNYQLPTSLRAAIDILYAVILVLAIIFLFAVVFLGFKQPRRARPAAQSASTVEAASIAPQSSAERVAEQQRKRERRQKAAEARRRHAGRA